MAAPKPSSWLTRAIAVSIAAHVALGVVGRWALPARAPVDELVDVEVAPEAPPVEALPEEKLRQEQAAAAAAAAAEAEAPEVAAASTPPRHEDEGIAAIDAGIDAPVDAHADAAIDARPDARPKPDAAIDAAVADAMLVAAADAGTGSAAADASVVAIVDNGSGSGSPETAAVDGSGSGSPQAAAETGSGSGSPKTATAAATGSGSAATGSGAGSDALAGFSGGSAGGSDSETAAAVDGAPTTAGTAANLLAYFPAGHVVTALIRFDRLRTTEWADIAEKILRPLPDYQVLFDAQHPPHLADKLDTLVISTPAPRDATATTLVARTALSRAALRDLLTFPVGPKRVPSFTWSPAKGGMLGRRTVAPRDKRVVLAPFRGWFVLTQPDNLATLTAKATGDLDKLEAPPALLPAWLDGIRKIESETGDPRGPALVVTVGGAAKRYKLPDVGLGVDSIMTPLRASLAAELVKQGWLVRGNVVFASEADAAEFVAAVAAIQQRVADSHLLQLALRRSHALHALTGLSVARAGDRVSYATSISIADARALLEVTAQTLSEYYGAKP